MWSLGPKIVKKVVAISENNVKRSQKIITFCDVFRKVITLKIGLTVLIVFNVKTVIRRLRLLAGLTTPSHISASPDRKILIAKSYIRNPPTMSGVLSIGGLLRGGTHPAPILDHFWITPKR